MELSDRKKEILKAVIKEYILTAEPIGSRTISKRYQLNVSSATIRNEMADLEEMGYIKQPHTSAGRIPSNKGYRIYVDLLMDVQKIPSEAARKIKKEYLSKKQEARDIMAATSQVLSNLTRYTALVASPKSRDNTFRNIQLIPLEGKEIMIIIVNGSGMIHHQKKRLQGRISRKKLDDVSRIINEICSDLPLNQIGPDLLNQIENKIASDGIFLDVMTSLSQILASTGEKWDRIYLGGTTNILDQPEFADLEKVKVVLRLLEQENILRELLNSLPSRNLDVIIGEENQLEAIKDCSMVTADYSLGGQSFGKLAILGPTRMEYPKVVAIVEFMSRVLSKVLQEED